MLLDMRKTIHHHRAIEYWLYWLPLTDDILGGLPIRPAGLSAGIFCSVEI